MDIEVKTPTEEDLKKLGVRNWPVWQKEESIFDWYYEEKEVCYFLEGNVEVEIPGGRTVKIVKGNLAIFPKGLKCKWHIKKKVKKHYNFG
ncbi:MAG: cupin domain-containing protein [Omnitrophica bacterium]|nr:cupin domain-containing protein [Candidatus Omnitrophota bacterium]